MSFLRKLYLKWKISRMSPEQVTLALQEARAINRQLERLQYILDHSNEIDDMLKKQGIDPTDVGEVDRYLRSVGI